MTLVARAPRIAQRRSLLRRATRTRPRLPRVRAVVPARQLHDGSRAVRGCAPTASCADVYGRAQCVVRRAARHRGLSMRPRSRATRPYAPPVTGWRASMGQRRRRRQPTATCRTLEIHASQKGARFVQWCDALKSHADHRRHARSSRARPSSGRDDPPRPQLAHAIARDGAACVRRRRKGTAARTRDGFEDIGADLVLAWPTARSR